MQLALPVRRDMPGRTGSGLIQRVVPRRRELRALGVLVGLEVPEPVLARFIALDVSVPARVEMASSVLLRR